MIEFDILLGMPTYASTVNPSKVFVPDGDIDFTPNIINMELLSTSVRRVNGIDVQYLDLRLSADRRKIGVEYVNMHYDHSGVLVGDIGLTVATTREISEFEQSGTQSLKFIIDPLESSQTYTCYYILSAWNKEFSLYIPGLHGKSGSVQITPRSYKSLQIANTGVLPAGQYALDVYAWDNDELTHEVVYLVITGYSMLVDFGDGTDKVLVDANSELLHTYNEDGIYEVLVLVNFDGPIAAFRRTIEVKGPIVIADGDWLTWWVTELDAKPPHWAQVSF